MKVTISSQLILSAFQSMPLKMAVVKSLTIPNPKYIEAERMGRYTGVIQKDLSGASIEQGTGNLIVPRGFGYRLPGMAKRYGEPVTWEDQRRTLPEVAFEFIGHLRPYQQTAVDACTKRDWGLLCAPTGAGKTVMASAIIAKRKQPALVVVHTKELMTQWIDRLQAFLNVPKDEIGVIGNGKKRMGDMVTVALVQTLYGCADDVSEHVGIVVADECHRVPSRTFTEAITAFDCKFMLGLSATPYRRDGLSAMIGWYLGDTTHRIQAGQLVESGALCRAEVKQVETDFATRLDASLEYSKVLLELSNDENRNHLVAQWTAREASTSGGIVLCLSDRKQHCKTLQEILQHAHAIDAEVLTGNLSNSKRAALVDRLRAGKIKTLIATGQLVGEGFDLPGIESILLATPLKFSGRVIQYIGRSLRPSEGKTNARIIDFVDSSVGVLQSGAKSRESLYRRTPGITIVK